jgi:hypothetical protein
MKNDLDINRFYQLLESTIGDIKPLLTEQQVNNVNLTAPPLNVFNTTINKLNGKQILDLANSWGWKGEFLNGPFDKNAVNDTTINASKEFLKSIGWPKFGDPNSKKTNTVDVNKLISQSKQELQQKKYTGLYGQGTSPNEKTIAIDDSNIPYNLCLKNVKENMSNMSIKDLQKFDSVESYCKSNSYLYDFQKHVEKYGGVHGFFESVREFLLSPSGVAAQIALSFTGIGNIATIVVWAIMLIYDCFAISMGKSNWLNIIIDVVSLATAGKGGGIIGKLISKFGPEIGASFNTLINKVITYLSESKLGKWVIESIKGALEKMTSLLDNAYNVMKTSFNINWVDKTIGTAKQWLNNIVQWFKKIPEKIGEKIAANVTSNVAKGTIQRYVKSVFGKNSKFTTQLIQGMENLTQEQIKKAAGQYIEDVSVKLAKKQAEDMKNATIEDVLIAIDSKFGTKMSKLFMVYVYGKKFGKEVTNVSTGKSIDKVNYTVDAARGDYYLNKLGDYNKRLAAIVGPDFQNL